eukprot:scaffold5893_cov37-Cyclotella_meneghiniana.AAC.1
MGELLNNLMKVELLCSGDTKNSSQANVKEASQKPIPKKAAKPAAKFKKNKAVRKYCDRCGGHGLENQAHTHRSEDCKRFDSNGKPKMFQSMYHLLLLTLNTHREDPQASVV